MKNYTYTYILSVEVGADVEDEKEFRKKMNDQFSEPSTRSILERAVDSILPVGFKLVEVY